MDIKMGRRLRNFFKSFLIILNASAIPLLLILYAVFANKNTELSSKITELEQRQEKLIEENKRLVSDISLLTSAERIEKIAEEELGMHKAETEDIVRVEMTGEKKK